MKKEISFKDEIQCPYCKKLVEYAPLPIDDFGCIEMEPVLCTNPKCLKTFVVDGGVKPELEIYKLMAVE